MAIFNIYLPSTITQTILRYLSHRSGLISPDTFSLDNVCYGKMEEDARLVKSSTLQLYYRIPIYYASLKFGSESTPIIDEILLELPEIKTRVENTRAFCIADAPFDKFKNILQQLTITTVGKFCPDGLSVSITSSLVFDLSKKLQIIDPLGNPIPKSLLHTFHCIPLIRIKRVEIVDDIGSIKRKIIHAVVTRLDNVPIENSQIIPNYYSRNMFPNCQQIYTIFNLWDTQPKKAAVVLNQLNYLRNHR